MLMMSASDNRMAQKSSKNLQVTKASETCQRILVDAADLVVGQIQLFESLQFDERAFTNPTQ